VWSKRDSQNDSFFSIHLSPLPRKIKRGKRFLFPFPFPPLTGSTPLNQPSRCGLHCDKRDFLLLAEDDKKRAHSHFSLLSVSPPYSLLCTSGNSKGSVLPSGTTTIQEILGRKSILSPFLLFRHLAFIRRYREWLSFPLFYSSSNGCGGKEYSSPLSSSLFSTSYEKVVASFPSLFSLPSRLSKRIIPGKRTRK